MNNKLIIPFGIDTNNKLIEEDLYNLPHLMIVGTTGSGKTVFLNTMITSLIKKNSPEELKLVLIDPKQVEMYKYKSLQHLYCPVINNSNDAYEALSLLVRVMEDRLSLLQKEGVTFINEYNKKSNNKLPTIVVVIDEYMDLFISNENINNPLISLLEKSRPVGIHIVLSSQRVNKSLINYFSTRVAFLTLSKEDSIDMIGETSATSLKGQGDMLIKAPSLSKELIRAQGTYINEKSKE